METNTINDMKQWVADSLYGCCQKCSKVHIRYEAYKSGIGSKSAKCYGGGDVTACPAWKKSQLANPYDKESQAKIRPPDFSPPMIDVKMTETALGPNKILQEVDRSWRNRLADCTEGIVRFPYPADKYNAVVGKFTVSVEGYCGKLKISKIAKGGMTYRLKRPVIVKDFRVLGVFDNHGVFLFYRVLPVIGFHFHGSESGDMIPKLCVGDIPLPVPKTLIQLQSNCKDIAKSLQVINADSIGKVHVPKFYNYIYGNIARGTISRIAKKLL